MKPYPNTWTGPDHFNDNGHDESDFVNPVGLGRSLLIAFSIVAACAALGIYLGSK